MYITNEAVGRVDYYQLISGKSEKNNCFSKFSSNSLDFFRVKPPQIMTFSLLKTRLKNSFRPPKFQHKKFAISFSLYFVKLNDNGLYHGLREPIRKLENHYPELKI